jgi:hypothetical protein
MSYGIHYMARTKPSRSRKLPIKVHSLSLTAQTMTQLERLAADLGDLSGRAVSISGAVRILAAFAAQEGYVLTVNRLLPIAEKQQRQTTWGKLPAKRAR